MADHRSVDVVVLFFVFGEELLWGGGSGVEERIMCLCGGVRHIVDVEFVRVELVVLGCVAPNKPSEF